jgi:diketogulonate reductase-like aldo/keto reductase
MLIQFEVGVAAARLAQRRRACTGDLAPAGAAAARPSAPAAGAEDFCDAAGCRRAFRVGQLAPRVVYSAQVAAEDSFVSARGTRMPRLIYGTAWKKERTAELVEAALSAGFRGIDTACQPKHYDEAGVGAGVAAARARGLQREQLYLQSKFTSLDGQDPRRIPYDATASLPEQVRQSCAASLSNLQTSYLDALILHSPLERFEHTLQVWRELEALVDRGVVRELGISNCYDLVQLQALVAAARVPPLVVQNRFYAKTGYDRSIRAFCAERGMLYQSFWTLSANPHILSHAQVRALAQRYGVTPAQLFFRGLTQIGIVPLTGTTQKEHMRQDLAIFELELEPPDLRQLMAQLGE